MEKKHTHHPTAAPRGSRRRRRAGAASLSVLVSLVVAAVLLPAPAGAEPARPTARSGDRSVSDGVTNFGFRADAYGTKLVTGGVEAFDLKDAHAQLVCTRSVGRSSTRRSAVSVPDNPLIDVALSTSRTETYRERSAHGVRATSTIGDVTIGGELPGGVRTPRLVIKGLTSTADAYHRNGRFGHAEGFDFTEIRLELLDNTVVESLPAELQQLLAPLDEVADLVFAGTGQVADEVFGVLQEVTRPVAIPGLGTVALGGSAGKATGRRATSEATALRIDVTATGERQRLELGRARARVGRGTPAGVFRSGGTAMDLRALRDNLHFGSVASKALPCEGTRGRTRTHRVRSASVLGGVLVRLSEVEYSHRGKQKRATRGRRPLAAGWSSTRIGAVEVPAAQLEIRDVRAKVRVRAREGRRAKRWVRTGIGSVTVAGQPVTVPAPGSSVDLPGGIGVLEHRLVRQRFTGAVVTALRVELFDAQVRIDLGTASGRVFGR